jgi:hypothetical protein
MVEGALDRHEQHAIEVHLDRCDKCRRVMAAMVGGGPTAIGTPQPRP